ncbi:hypothetical protein ACA910_005111 [Epithemia clementina (nom. ined.)]
MDFGNDDDDLFASLGGALMKNLLADLNDESGSGGLLSLEELEQELAHFEDRGDPLGIARTSAFDIQAPVTAASMVVQAQGQSQLASGFSQNENFNNLGSPLDAWSLSLEKFTAASLQDDFLQADVERKAKTSGLASASSLQQQSSLFQSAEDYDISEPLLVSPPPGLAPGNNNNAASQSLVSQLTTKLETFAIVDSESSENFAAPPPVPHPHAMPRTPQNSINLRSIPKPPPPTPQNSISINLGVVSPNSSEHMRGEVRLIHSIPEGTSTSAPPPKYADDPAPDVAVQPTPTPPVAVTQTAIPEAQQTAIPEAQQTAPPAAWNKPEIVSPTDHETFVPPQILSSPQARTVMYCNPLPNARSIPASAIATKFMSARDISYVVHSILKPILLHQQQNPISPFDYDSAFLQKTMGVVATTSGPTSTNQSNSAHMGQQQQQQQQQQQLQVKSLQEEMQSRAEKAKHWSTENSVLGRTAKSHVARPRSLIAQPTKEELEEANSNKNNSEQRQRQALWKARIYCDQAYQAYMNVVQTWHVVAVSPNQALTPAAAASLQPHLFKLLRCLGLSRSDQGHDLDITSDLQQQQQQQQQHHHHPTYVLSNDTALPLLTKLPKGRVLLARVLEQALLPPAAVGVLLPSLFKAMYVLPLLSLSGADPNSIIMVEDASSSQATQEQANDRVFAALSRVLQTLPEIPRGEILESLDVVQEHSTVALLSPVRMQAVHSLLQRGTQLATLDPGFAEDWKIREEAFLQVLSG